MEISAAKLKMDNAIVYFEKELSTIRTSRASISMLDNIYVDAYGAKSEISQLGNISILDANMITIQIWDNSLIKNIENAIIESNLGINPQTQGSLIRLPIPKLSEERRIELSKVASQYAENAKISIRNIRREALDVLKKEEKEKTISQDEQKNQSNEIQKIIDEFINIIDNMSNIKKTEIIKV